jgi:hypothetical protein
MVHGFPSRSVPLPMSAADPTARTITLSMKRDGDAI